MYLTIIVYQYDDNEITRPVESIITFLSYCVFTPQLKVHDAPNFQFFDSLWYGLDIHLSTPYFIWSHIVYNIRTYTCHYW